MQKVYVSVSEEYVNGNLTKFREVYKLVDCVDFEVGQYLTDDDLKFLALSRKHTLTMTKKVSEKSVFFGPG